MFFWETGCFVWSRRALCAAAVSRQARLAKEISMQLTHIASNGYYSVSVDTELNRLHLYFAGTWVRADQVPNWLDDVKAGLRLVSPGFTLLTNCTKLHGVLRLDFIVEAERLILEAGLERAAQLYNPKRIVAKTLMEAAAEDAGLQVKQFVDPLEAEAYLES